MILRAPVPNPSLNVPIVLCSLNSLNYVMDLQFNISDIITSYYRKQRRHVPVWKRKDIALRKGISSSCLFPSHMHMQIFRHKSLYSYLSVHSLFLGCQGCSFFLCLGSGWKVLWLIKFMVIIIGSGTNQRSSYLNSDICGKTEISCLTVLPKVWTTGNLLGIREEHQGAHWNHCTWFIDRKVLHMNAGCARH